MSQSFEDWSEDEIIFSGFHQRTSFCVWDVMKKKHGVITMHQTFANKQKILKRSKITW